MGDRFDAIVIGSGFGGAVSACRLAQAGQRVLILERGQRFESRELGKKVCDSAHWLWSVSHGLFDVRNLGGMLVVQSAAWGGGSQIYANVHLRPPPEVFQEPRWPAGITRPALDPYYDLVAYMLDILPISVLGDAQPAKTRAFRDAARELKRDADFFYPNIAVRFAPDGNNKFGIPQTSCRMCGECDVGCPYGAKNTLDLNYLAIAERMGATVRTRSNVVDIAPAEGGGYRVTYHSYDDVSFSAEATSVFVCAGAINTVELLLHCRQSALPRLSQRLGHDYSGNGDYLGFGWNIEKTVDPAEGPTITTALRYDRLTDDGTWFLLEEGGFPNLSLILEASQGQADEDPAVKVRSEELESRFLDQKSTAVMLCMGRDRGDGRIYLEGGSNDVAIEWSVEGDLPLYHAQERLCTDVIQAMGGKFIRNPAWQFLRKPVSVHNLGGCPIGLDAATGVIDEYGEVHGYPGLFVMDGAAVPGATGVNPSSTIAALAERNIERYIRRRLSNPGWTAPERASAVTVKDPLGELTRGVPSPKPTTPVVGVRFTETMKGYFSIGTAPSSEFDPAEFERAETEGKRMGARLEFTLTITMPNLLEKDDASVRSGTARGVLRAGALTSDRNVEVQDGLFQLFVDPPKAGARLAQAEKRMNYLLPFIATDNQAYLLDGMKVIKDRPWRFDLWSTTTTLYTVIREGHTRAGRVVATGIVHIHTLDFLKQLTTMRLVGSARTTQKVRAAFQFSRLFLGSLVRVFGRWRSR